jgi:hypothetical protein
MDAPNYSPATKLQQYLPYIIQTLEEKGKLTEGEETLYTRIIAEAGTYMELPEHSQRYGKVIPHAWSMREHIMMSASGPKRMAQAAAVAKAALVELNEL